MEFSLVPTPAMFPGRCLCGGQQVPILDTFWNMDAFGRVYICKTCAERISRAYGFIESEELEKLRDARVFRDKAEKDIEERNEIIKHQEEIIKEKNGVINEQKDQITYHSDRVTQLTKALNDVREEAIHHIESVTGVS
jgi:uncharacterized coiled-coil protein SlyX